MAILVERFANSAADTLNGGITAAQTTLTLNDASGFPVEGDYRILCESEIMLVTAVSGNILTIVRGREATTGAIHATSSVVTMIATAGGFTQAILDGYGAAPAANNGFIVDDSAATLAVGDFTWLNQGSATAVAADDGGINMTTPAEASRQIRGKYITAPAAPWVITARIQFGPGFAIEGGAGIGSTIGLIARESSTSKLYYHFLKSDLSGLWRMTDVTTYSATVDSDLNNQNDSCWLRLQDDNTSIRGHISYDGVNFFEAWNESRTAFLAGGANQVGFAVESGTSAAGALHHFKSWILE